MYYSVYLNLAPVAIISPNLQYAGQHPVLLHLSLSFEPNPLKQIMEIENFMTK